MKPRPPLPGGPYLVVGLARSGLAAALALRARGEEVIGCDAGAGEDPRLAEAAGRLSEAGVEVHLDASGDVLAARARTLIKSPGVPSDAPAIRAARRQGVLVLGELELAWRLIPNEFIAVTGTNGKTTTSGWIGHIHRCAGRPVAVAGNVGTAASSLVEVLEPAETLVCETSSFQLEDTEAFSPEAAVLLNLAPDHLDRHSTFEAYMAAKLRVFAHQDHNDVAVLPGALQTSVNTGKAQRVVFGTEAGSSLTLRDGRFWWQGAPLVEIEELSLPGMHNAENAMAASAVCLARGLDPDAVATGLKTFQGVTHRLELVAVRDEVAYVNDSKATNVASTVVALRAYEGGVHLIAGGRGKQEDFGPLAPLVAERCRGVYLIGEAAGELAAALRPVTQPVLQLGELAAAFEAARGAAQPGDTVLLSPACASYDQYPDFEARGEHFRALVEGA